MRSAQRNLARMRLQQFDSALGHRHAELVQLILHEPLGGDSVHDDSPMRLVILASRLRLLVPIAESS
jgi:hypothetical protein